MNIKDLKLRKKISKIKVSPITKYTKEREDAYNFSSGR